MKKIIVAISVFTVMQATGQNSGTVKDQKFINTAVEVNLMEVKLAQLALANGSAKEIKDLAQQLMDNNAEEFEKLTSLVSKKNMTMPATLSKEGEDEYIQLSKKSGSDFDKAYTACMVKEHKNVISEFTREANSGDDAEIKVWASKRISILQRQQKMAKSAFKIAEGEK